MQRDCDPKLCKDVIVLNSVQAVKYQVFCVLKKKEIVPYYLQNRVVTRLGFC